VNGNPLGTYFFAVTTYLLKEPGADLRRTLRYTSLLRMLEISSRKKYKLSSFTLWLLYAGNPDTVDIGAQSTFNCWAGSTLPESLRPTVVVWEVL
jgi:hypothetical protein